MDNSLLQIRDFGTKEIEQAVKTFTQNPQGMAEFVEAVKQEALGRAVAFIGDPSEVSETGEAGDGVIIPDSNNVDVGNSL